MSLYTETSGQGADLFLVHGWGMNAGVWDPLLPRLESFCRVTRVELPGHGASPLPAAQADLRDWAEACVEVAPAGACWLGWSLGAQVALCAAIEHPDDVGGLFLVGGTPRFVQAGDWQPAMADAVFRGFAESLVADIQGTLKRFLALQVKGSTGARDTLKVLREAVERRPAAAAAGLDQGLELLLSTDLRAHLAGLQCPTEWLFGERDTLVPRAAAHALREILPDAAIHLVEGAGHAPFLSHPDVCLPLLRNHLEGRRAA